jgi:uncharacterized protein YbaR (Trm112 family)
MFVCPATRQPLQQATDALVAKLAAMRDSLKNRAGQTPEPFDGGMITVDACWFYPTRGGIPILLLEEAIAL